MDEIDQAIAAVEKAEETLLEVVLDKYLTVNKYGFQGLWRPEKGWKC